MPLSVLIDLTLGNMNGHVFIADDYIFKGYALNFVHTKKAGVAD